MFPVMLDVKELIFDLTFAGKLSANVNNVDALTPPDCNELNKAAAVLAPAFTSALALGLFCTAVFTNSVTLIGIIIFLVFVLGVVLLTRCYYLIFLVLFF